MNKIHALKSFKSDFKRIANFYLLIITSPLPEFIEHEVEGYGFYLLSQRYFKQVQYNLTYNVNFDLKLEISLQEDISNFHCDL